MAARFLPLLLSTMVLAPAPLLAQTEEAIVVTGTREQPSDWRQAETPHVIVLSDGSEAELVRIAHNLERLHFLLSVLLNRVDARDDTVKLRVTLVGKGAEFAAMDLQNLRSAEGPYAKAFEMRRYYDPREDGAVMAVSRVDHRVTLERGIPLGLILPDLVRSINGPPTPGDPSTMETTGLSSSYGSGALRFPDDDPFAINVGEKAVSMSAEGRIYAGFAQHYLLTYFPAAYPRWYVDGFGEIFSRISVKQDGRIEYGRQPEGYSRVLDEYGNYPGSSVLTGRYFTDKAAGRKWTPFHAWALTHMLFFSPERRAQLHAYLQKVAAGATQEEASSAFGDLALLDRELIKYDNGKMPYEQMTYPAERAPEPAVRRLTRGEAAFVKGRLELGARLDTAALVQGDEAGTTLAAIRASWLRRLRDDAARYPANVHAQLLLAEAECRMGNGAECVRAADRALAADPSNSDAMAWKGSGQIRSALASGRDPGAIRAARSTIARANRNDPDNPLALILYYRSFADAGEMPPDIAVEGLMKAVDLVPPAPAPRILLGEALVERGLADEARKVLLPVANGAYQMPEAADARRLLIRLDG